jgi:hypothetical protein
MPAGTVHAVYTPEPCLAVGGTFFTAKSLYRSITTMGYQELRPHISNEDLNLLIYKRHAASLKYLKRSQTSLEDPSLIVRLAGCMLDYRKRSKKDVGQMISSGPGLLLDNVYEAREEFLCHLKSF